MTQIMQQTLYLLAILLLGSLLASPAAAATYKWVDEEGNTVYSQHPPPSENIPYDVLGEVRSRAPRGSDSPAPSTATQEAREGLEATRDARLEQQKIDEELAKAQELRQQNCEAARASLEVYTVYRRITNEAGEVEILDDAVRQQRIEEAKQAVRDFCD